VIGACSRVTSSPDTTTARIGHRILHSAAIRSPGGVVVTTAAARVIWLTIAGLRDLESHSAATLPDRHRACPFLHAVEGRCDVAAPILRPWCR
jgi:hypothetical protein